jgi:hypothetical protein
MTNTSSVGEVRDMDEDGPNGSPYEMLEKHNQSETKHDRSGIEQWSTQLSDDIP